jgi:hypothetical protein
MRILRLAVPLRWGALLLGELAATVWGQSQGQQPTPQPSPPPTYRSARDESRANDAANAAQRRQSNDAYRRMQENMMRVRVMNSRTPGAVLPIVATEDELTPNERKALAPAPEDRKAHEEFLRQPDTGIFRLLRVTAGTGKVVRAGDAAASTPVFLIGGGAHYSFSKQNHNADKWSELCWEKDEFVVGIAGESLSLLVDLGDVRLDEITTESRGVDYLSKLSPPERATEAEQQFLRLDSGLTVNGFDYHLSLPWKLNTTYALRSVNYGRSDLLVVFRAVRQDANESLIVLWRKLKSYRAPKLKKDAK